MESWRCSDVVPIPPIDLSAQLGFGAGPALRQLAQAHGSVFLRPVWSYSMERVFVPTAVVCTEAVGLEDPQPEPPAVSLYRVVLDVAVEPAACDGSFTFLTPCSWSDYPFSAVPFVGTTPLVEGDQVCNCAFALGPEYCPAQSRPPRMIPPTDEASSIAPAFRRQQDPGNSIQHLDLSGPP